MNRRQSILCRSVCISRCRAIVKLEMCCGFSSACLLFFRKLVKEREIRFADTAPSCVVPWEPAQLPQNTIRLDWQEQKRAYFVSMDEITIETYLRKRVLARNGINRKVVLCARLPHGEMVAIKIVRKSNTSNPQVDPLAEVAAMRYLNPEGRHQHTIFCLNAFQDERDVYIITQYKPEGNLSHYIAKYKPSESQVREIFKLIISNLKHIHDKQVCHLDIKADNILVETKNDSVTATTIIDMGNCLRLSNERECSIPPRGQLGTLKYMAPEIWLNKKPFDGYAADIWSLGVLLFEMLTQSMPYEQVITHSHYKFWIAEGNLGTDVTSTRWNQMSQGDRDNLSNLRTTLGHFRPQARLLLQGMLNPEVSNRLTLQQVRELAYAW